MLFCHLLVFLKVNFLKNSFWNTFRVSNSLDPDQARHFFGPDLGPNCLQSLSADDTSRQKSGSKLFAKVISRRHLWAQICIQTVCKGDDTSKQRVNSRQTSLVLSFDKQSHFSRKGTSISSSGALSGVVQLLSEGLYMGKCCTKTVDKISAMLF